MAPAPFFAVALPVPSVCPCFGGLEPLGPFLDRVLAYCFLPARFPALFWGCIGPVGRGQVPLVFDFARLSFLLYLGLPSQPLSFMSSRSEPTSGAVFLTGTLRPLFTGPPPASPDLLSNAPPLFFIISQL